MNPDVAAHLDHEGGRLLVGLEASEGILATLLVPVDASQEDVVNVTGRLRNEATNELAYLEQVGVPDAADDEVETEAEPESGDGTKYGRQGVGEDVLVTDGGTEVTSRYRIGDVFEKLRSLPSKSAALVCLDDAWSRPGRQGEYGVEYPTHDLEATYELVAECWRVLVDGGWLIADADDWLAPRLETHIREEYGDVTATGEYEGGGYRRRGSVTYVDASGEPDRSTAGMYLANSGYSVLFAHRGPTSRRTTVGARQVARQPRRVEDGYPYGWGSIKPVGPYANWIDGLTDVDELVVVPCAGTAPAAIAAEQLGREWLAIDCQPEAREGYRRRREAYLERKQSALAPAADGGNARSVDTGSDHSEELQTDGGTVSKAPQGFDDLERVDVDVPMVAFEALGTFDGQCAVVYHGAAGRCSGDPRYKTTIDWAMDTEDLVALCPAHAGRESDEDELVTDGGRPPLLDIDVTEEGPLAHLRILADDYGWSVETLVENSRGYLGDGVEAVTAEARTFTDSPEDLRSLAGRLNTAAHRLEQINQGDLVADGGAQVADRETAVLADSLDGWDAVDDPENYLRLRSADGKSRIFIKEITISGGDICYRVILYTYQDPDEWDGQFIGEGPARSRGEIPDVIEQLESELHGWGHADVGDVPTNPGPVERVGPPPEKIGGLDDLVDRMADARTIEDWSYILNDHVQWGNNTKVHKSVGIFNLSSAHDCVNRGTDRCQVGPNECYAVVDERTYDYVWHYFRRQEYLWDCLDAETFADALIEIIGRKHSPPTAFKFNQAGDFRHQGDVVKVDRIAGRLADHDVPVFTYSASSHLDWSDVEHVVVNRSDPAVEYGNRRYKVVDYPSQIPDDAIHCPYDAAKHDGKPLEERPKCGECVACIRPEGPDVAIVKHSRGPT